MQLKCSIGLDSFACCVQVALIMKSMLHLNLQAQHILGSAGTAYVWICRHSICFGSAGTAYVLDLHAQHMLWICRHSICFGSAGTADALDLQAQHMLGSAGTAHAWICRHSICLDLQAYQIYVNTCTTQPTLLHVHSNALPGPVFTVH